MFDVYDVQRCSTGYRDDRHACVSCGIVGHTIMDTEGLICTNCGTVQDNSIMMVECNFGQGQGSNNESLQHVNQTFTEGWRKHVMPMTTHMGCEGNMSKLSRELHIQSNHQPLSTSIRRDIDIMHHIAALDDNITNDNDNLNTIVEMAIDVAYKVKSHMWNKKDDDPNRQKAHSNRGRQRQANLLACYVLSCDAEGKHIKKVKAMRILQKMEYFERTPPQDIAKYYHDGTKNIESMLAVIDRSFLMSRNGVKDIVGTVKALCMASSTRTFSKRHKLFYTCKEVVHSISKRDMGCQRFMQSHYVDNISASVVAYVIKTTPWLKAMGMKITHVLQMAVVSCIPLTMVTLTRTCQELTVLLSQLDTPRPIVRSDTSYEMMLRGLVPDEPECDDDDTDAVTVQVTVPPCVVEVDVIDEVMASSRYVIV